MKNRCEVGRLECALTPANVVAAYVVLLTLVSGAQAQISDPFFAVDAANDSIVAVEASNESGTGHYSVEFWQGEWGYASQTLTWSLPEPVELYDDVSGDWVATLLNADLLVRATQDCRIDLNAGVIAGGSPTTFVIASPLVSFETVSGAYAQGGATATVTLTHASGEFAYLVGLGPSGTGVFRSYYDGYLAEGTRFTHLVGSIYVDSGGTAEATQFDPAYGYRAISADVWDVSAELAFMMTAGDLAFATTSHGMPEPDVCLGDVNADGVVDAQDLSELLAAYGTTVDDPDYNPDADFDGNGCIDVADLAALLAVFGTSC